jgi:hypothetical protein
MLTKKELKGRLISTSVVNGRPGGKSQGHGPLMSPKMRSVHWGSLEHPRVRKTNKQTKSGKCFFVK